MRPVTSSPGGFESFAAHGVRVVRLDAVGYVIKKAGTSCFMVEPEIYGFLDWIIEIADDVRSHRLA